MISYPAPVSPIQTESAYRYSAAYLSVNFDEAMGLCFTSVFGGFRETESGMAHRNMAISVVETAPCRDWGNSSCIYRSDWVSGVGNHA